MEQTYDIKAQVKKLMEQLTVLQEQETKISFNIKLTKAQLKKWEKIMAEADELNNGNTQKSN